MAYVQPPTATAVASLEVKVLISPLLEGALVKWRECGKGKACCLQALLFQDGITSDSKILASVPHPEEGSREKVAGQNI